MGTSGPVTVVVIGESLRGDLAELPGVRLVARVDDPRRAPRLVGDARPQVVLAGLGRDRDAVLAVVPELTARVPGTPVLALAGTPEGRTRPPTCSPPCAPGRRATSWTPPTRGRSPTPSGARPRGSRCSARGWPRSSWRRPALVGAVRARLTAREGDVLRLVVDGLTARQIATRLVLSPRTVENHIQRVLRRLDVPNRAALVRYAIENGLA